MNFNVGKGVIKAEEVGWEGIRPASTFTAECYAKRHASELRVLKKQVQSSVSSATDSDSVSGQILANMFPGNTVPMYLCQGKMLLCFKQRLAHHPCIHSFPLFRVTIHAILET